jgi:multidrug efflux pump subunit AcrA (membrane-fusion protein)
VSETVNPKTRRITIRCLVPNAGGRLKPEMFATVLLEQTDVRRAVVVPSSAIQSMSGEAAVFVAEGGDRFRAQPVKIGTEADNQTEIVSGLRSGDQVVVSGGFVLKSELLRSSTGGE